MKTMIAAFILLIAAPVRAQLSGCQYTSGPQTLSKVRSTASGTQIIGCINDSFDRLSSTGTSNSTTAIHTADWVQAHRISGLSTGTVGIRISSLTYRDAGTYDRNLGSATIEGAGGLGVTYGITAATITATSSITASAFFGDGSHLDSLPGETSYFASAKTFGSSVTVNSDIGGNGRNLTGVEVFLSSQGVTATSSFSFGLTAPSSSTVNCLLTVVQNTTAGYPYIQFNGDSGSNYRFMGSVVALTAVGAFGNNGATNINLSDSAKTYSAGAQFVTSFSLMKGSGIYTELTGHGAGYTGGATAFAYSTFGGEWNGGANPTYATITTSAGAMTGALRCTYIGY